MSKCRLFSRVLFLRLIPRRPSEPPQVVGRNERHFAVFVPLKQKYLASDSYKVAEAVKAFPSHCNKSVKSVLSV